LPLWLPHKILKRNPARQYCDSREKKKKKKGAWQTPTNKEVQNSRTKSTRAVLLRTSLVLATVVGLKLSHLPLAIIDVKNSFASTFGLENHCQVSSPCFFTGEREKIKIK
jgi:hypothetical protein